MFLRKLSINKDGKRHDYWALIESVRTERGPRHRVVSYLGDMDEAGRLEVRSAAEGHARVQEELFEKPRPEWVEVNVRKVRVERPRHFGDVWLALELTKKLGLGELLDCLLPETSAACDTAQAGRPPKIAWAGYSPTGKRHITTGTTTLAPFGKAGFDHGFNMQDARSRPHSFLPGQQPHCARPCDEPKTGDRGSERRARHDELRCKWVG